MVNFEAIEAEIQAERAAAKQQKEELISDYQPVNFQQDSILFVEIEKLTEITSQPFRLYSEEKLRQLTESIRLNGVLSPISIRPSPDGSYQIIDGRNRKNACRLLGLSTIPAIIKDVDDDTAHLILIDANLNRGSELFPMERAFAYKMKLDTLRHQGKSMPELTSTQVVSKLRSNEQVGAANDESRETVRRYIALTKLIQPFQDKIDSNELPFIAGVNISYLLPQEQELVLDYISQHQKSISVGISKKLKELSKQDLLSEESIPEIFESKPKHLTQVKINYKKIKSYFSQEATQEEIEETILKALELYQHREEKI